MGVGAFLEPLVVIVLLFGGTWINRELDLPGSVSRKGSWHDRGSRSASGDKDDIDIDDDGLLGPEDGRPLSPSLLSTQQDPWRKREVGFWRWRWDVVSPNTVVFRDRLLSRLLRKFPFLAECWYWALVYWIYQLGRAFTAVTLKDDTVDVAREHALQLIKLEEKLHIFWELPLQRYFLQHPVLLLWTNRLYSFIHIPGTIAFLVWLYYYTTIRRPLVVDQAKDTCESNTPAGPALYEARRRTMAVCNLIAFVVFTLWPCMPPRLLSDESVEGYIGDISRSYGFVDTVHNVPGASSVWTANKFCNQYAAMPSLHFGYSLMIGLTVMTIPLAPRPQKLLTLPFFNHARENERSCLTLPCRRRVACVILGVSYPLMILIAIVATANHFILDAAAGAVVCGLGWWGNSVLLNLVPLEDYFLRLVRIHKPERVELETYKPGYSLTDTEALPRRAFGS
ncbi:hypothetical protein FQN54_003321 [Arachnomyces sp. PD_36]|nr:hypothetical protein FQN54_003321 [Arachnomyces sp. PD_36]